MSVPRAVVCIGLLLCVGEVWPQSPTEIQHKVENIVAAKTISLPDDGLTTGSSVSGLPVMPQRLRIMASC